MTKRIVHIIASLWLAVILLFGTTPKEFVHLFADHKDTVHCATHDKAVVENAHHHCTFLGFELMPFAADYQVPRISFVPTVYITLHEALQLHFVQRDIIRVSLRGPPVV